MNVLLIEAYHGRTESPVYPLGLSCLASSLKAHNLKVFDPNVSSDYVSELSDMLKHFDADVVGISLRNIDSTNKRKVVFYYPYLTHLIDVIKAGSSRNSKIVVGGSGFSIYANEIMQDEQRIDYGVFLEGENTFPELLRHLGHPHAVRGVFYRDNGRLLFTGPNDQVDFAATDLPDRTLVPSGPYLHIPDAIGVETKRGCILSCTYCVYGFLNGTTFRLKDPVRVVDEIQSLVSDMNIKSFTFVDSVFNIPLSHAEAVCRAMIKRRLPVSWSAWFHEGYLNAEFLDLVRAAGCKKIILSPDGFSDTVLYKLGKSVTKKDILRTYDILRAVDDIEICYNFFKTPPGQSLSTFLRLMAFYFKAKLRLKGRIHFEFNSIRIQPHTNLYRIALDEGWVEKGEPLLFPKYYKNNDSFYIEKIFNAMLLLKGK
jgi:anaerobic magnesium-protoporphyrin IX monomethyl ester cyclase